MAMSQEFLAKIKLTMEGSADTASKLQQIKTQMAGVSEPTKQVTSGMNDLEKAFRRALIVAPVWMAAREAIKQTIAFVQEGIQYYVDTEKAILNVQSAIQTLGGVGSTTISELTSRFHDLSVETGLAEAAVANIFAEMTRVLGNTTTAWNATSAAVRLHEATGADAAKIAETLGMLYKANGETLNKAATETQRFRDLQIMLYEAQAKTPGGIEKLNANLLAGIPIMTSANISIEDFIKLNQAMAASGIQSGQALKTGLTKIITNLAEVSNEMGLTFSKNTPTMTVFMTVMDKLGAAMKTGAQGNVGQVIKDIFGGVRGGQIAAIAKDIDTLKQSMNTPLVNERSTYLYNQQIKAVEESVPHQIELFGNLKKQAGEAFITGILGGHNMAEAMQNANAIMEGSIIKVQALGVAFNQIGKGIGFYTSLGTAPFVEAAKTQTKEAKDQYDLETRILMALKGQLSVDDMMTMTGEIQNANDGRTLEQKKTLIDMISKQAVAENNITKAKEEQNVKANDAIMLSKKQANELENLVLKYAKAAPGERRKIGREIELAQMTPEAQVSAFTSGMSGDRKLLLEMMPKLSEEVRSQLTGIIARESGLNLGGRFGTAQGNAPEYPGWVTGSSALARAQATAASGNINVSNKAADIIQLYIDSKGEKDTKAMIEVIKNAIENKLLTDEDFQKAFGKQIGNKV